MTKENGMFSSPLWFHMKTAWLFVTLFVEKHKSFCDQTQTAGCKAGRWVLWHAEGQNVSNI